MILLEKSGSGAGKPETGRTSDVSRGAKKNGEAFTVCSLQYDKKKLRRSQLHLMTDQYSMDR